MNDTFSPDAFLTRTQAAEFLTTKGFPTTARALDTVASRGGGPAYRLYANGRRALYSQDDLLAWARSRLGTRRTSTSEAA